MSKNFMRCFVAQLDLSGKISCQSRPLLQEDHCLQREGVDYIYLDKERPKSYLGSSIARGYLLVCNRVAGGFGIYGDYDLSPTEFPVLLTFIHPGFEAGSVLFNLAASFRKIASSKVDTTTLLLGDERQEFCLKFIEKISAREISVVVRKSLHELDIAVVPQIQPLQVMSHG